VYRRVFLFVCGPLCVYVCVCACVCYEHLHEILPHSTPCHLFFNHVDLAICFPLPPPPHTYSRQHVAVTSAVSALLPSPHKHPPTPPHTQNPTARHHRRVSHIQYSHFSSTQTCQRGEGGRGSILTRCISCYARSRYDE